VKTVWRWVRIVAGFVLLLGGIAGLFLPFLQGIAMIVAGLILLGREFHWARRLLEWAKRRWHSVRGAVAAREAGSQAKD
jgi:uncharacterized protein YqgC (DUF456 family)